MRVSDQDLPEIATVEEVAKYLRLNHKTVREMIARGEIPAGRVGRRRTVAIRIHRDAVLDWLRQSRGPTGRNDRGTQA